MAGKPDREEDQDQGSEDLELEPWYAWSRWKWIGAGMFLTLGVVVIGYAIWDEIDYRPKPIDWPIARLMLRDLPLRIAGYLALIGFISFGPPAGVDLMLGAKKAAERWVQRKREEDRAEGRAKGHAEGRVEGRVEGRAEGRAEERKKIRKLLEDFAKSDPDERGIQRLIDQLADDE